MKRAEAGSANITHDPRRAATSSADHRVSRFWTNTSDAGTGLDVSIIIPTRNETENVGAMLSAIDALARSLDIEVIFVDDSDDDTTRVIESEAKERPFSVSYIHRPKTARNGGLGGAVVAGMRRAQAEWACVIDADLQHPPHVIPDLVHAGLEQSTDIVVATRYEDDGSVGEFDWHRVLISRVTGLAARLFFPRALSGVSDPMSGFFAVRLAAIDIDSLRPQGFKILLEILARSDRLRVAEVGYTFGERHAGDSNAGLDEGFRFLQLLWTLRTSTTNSGRFAGFAAVGLSGFFVNLLFVALFTEIGGIHYLISALLATQVSTSWNYVLTDSFVFAERATNGWLRGLLRFAIINNAAFLARGPMIVLLTAGLGFHYLTSTFVSLAALTFLRFLLAKNWIWKAPKREVSL